MRTANVLAAILLLRSAFGLYGVLADDCALSVQVLLVAAMIAVGTLAALYILFAREARDFLNPQHQDFGP